MDEKTIKLVESEKTENVQAEEIERLQGREVELDDLLHDLQSEHISLTRLYGETKKELKDVNDKLKHLEEDFANNVDSDEINKRLNEQLKSELESLKIENDQMKENEETQRKIIKQLKTVCIFKSVEFALIIHFIFTLLFLIYLCDCFHILVICFNSLQIYVQLFLIFHFVFYFTYCSSLHIFGDRL